MPHAPATVIAHIQGGLGNQLFCYAAGRALSLRNDLPLRINTISGYRKEKFQRSCLLRSLNIDAQEANRVQAYRYPLGRSVRSKHAKRDANRPLPQRTIAQEPRDQQYLPGLQELKPKHDVYLLGYWQDERYFIDAREQLVRDLTLKADTPYAPDPQYSALVEDPNTVCVHVRSYAEVLDPAPNLILDATYYGPALDAVRKRMPDATFLVFSDKPDWAQQIISQAEHAEHAIFVQPTTADDTTATLTDFKLMTSCRHHVVGNSSFSWWAAWLGEREGSVVVAPPTGLPGHGRGMPKRWLALLS